MQISTLQRLAKASSLSYLTIDRIPSSPYYQSSKLQPLFQVVDATSQSGATVFNYDDSSIIVACRGSANLQNFGTNLKFRLVPADKLSINVPLDALVHEGFQDASLGLWRELAPKLDEFDFTGKDIVFTGHSLGGATALLCSVHYNASTQNKPTSSIVSFGGPKLCNSPLAQYLRNTALQDCDVLHLVHDRDPILANNQQLWDTFGFENVGDEIECDPKVPMVYEGKQQDGRFAWNILDHCNYLGVFVGPRLPLF